MNKKVLSLILALVMVLGTFANVFAAEAKEASKDAKKAENGEKVEKIVGKDNKIQYIIDKKFVEGYEDGSMGYDKNITRAEITRLLVLANGNEDLAKQLQGSLKIYSDVELAHWANGVINVGTTRPSSANGIAMLAGYPDGSFKPDRNVSYAELAKMLVVLVKKDLTAEMVKNAKWATSWMTWAAELGILEDVNVADSNAAANRADAFTMLYNALYKMVEFKRTPANETRGILSELTNQKLQLNQDTKKEYKIDSNTIFVTAQGRQQILRVNVMGNHDLYLGSLVRVLINDKNEVTHIIELGNPKDLALNGRQSTAGTAVADNPTWKNVADNTVSTVMYSNFKSANDGQDRGITSYAQFEFNDSRTSAKRVTFYGITNVVDKKITLRVNDKTEVYVANPANNQMRKVSGIVEALSLIGYQDYKGYKIPNVYAGFDTDGLKSVYKGYNVDNLDRHTAKVIVFNLVNKNKSADLYRVLETNSSKMISTIENAKGEKFDRNDSKNLFEFPLGTAGKLDVVEIDSFRDLGNTKIVIDHSDIVNFPIVKIVDKHDNYIKVEDAYGATAQFDIRDLDDIFSAKRFGAFEKGAKIQFALKEKYSSIPKAISILDPGTPLEGSMKGIAGTADKSVRVGKIVSINEQANTVTFLEVYDLANRDYKYGDTMYHVSLVDDIKALRQFVADKKAENKIAEVSFNAFNENGRLYAKNFRDNENGKVISYDASKDLNSIEGLLSDVKALVENTGKVNCSNYAALLAEYNKLEARVNSLNPVDKTKSWEGSAEATAFAAFKTELGDWKVLYEAGVKDSLAGVNSLIGLKVDDTKDGTVRTAIETALNGVQKSNKVKTIEVIDLKSSVGVDGYTVFTGKVKVSSEDGDKKCCVTRGFTIHVKAEEACQALQAGEPETPCGGVNGQCPAK